jgi:hypothetical protein
VGWDWIDLSVRDLAGATFESITSRYRKDRPVGLLAPLEHLEGYVALNVFAPLGTAWWAVTRSGFVSECRDSIRHLSGDKEARAAFMKDMRTAKIRKNDPQFRLLGQFADVLDISGAGVPSLSTNARYAERWRFWSVGFPAQYRDAVIDRLEREATQFGARGFFGIDESVILADPAGRSSTGSYLFHNIDYRFYGVQPERDRFRREVLGELKRAITMLESGAGFDVPIEPIWMIKGVVGFVLFPAVGQHPAEYDEPLAREILSYRARLVRLLGWPHQYLSVRNALNEFREQNVEFGRGIFEPFCIEDELNDYVDEMERRYPVLRERGVSS